VRFGSGEGYIRGTFWVCFFPLISNQRQGFYAVLATVILQFANNYSKINRISSQYKGISNTICQLLSCLKMIAKFLLLKGCEICRRYHYRL